MPIKAGIKGSMLRFEQMQRLDATCLQNVDICAINLDVLQQKTTLLGTKLRSYRDLKTKACRVKKFILKNVKKNVKIGCTGVAESRDAIAKM